MSREDIENRFTYHPPKDDEARMRHEYVRTTAAHFANGLEELLPESRERSLALTKIEEAMFWANAALARNQ